MVVKQGKNIAKRKKSVFREYLEIIVIALFLTFVIQSFVMGNHIIPSSSMWDTLQVGDRLFTIKFIYGLNARLYPIKIFNLNIGRWRPGSSLDIYHRFKDPKRGDIIVFRYPEDESVDYIKRIIGLPGDRVRVIDDKVYVNGELLTEPYTRFIEGSYRGDYVYDDVVVPEGHFFVMGDNRDNSRDSRYWGFVPRRNIVGRAFLIYYPLNHIRLIR